MRQPAGSGEGDDRADHQDGTGRAERERDDLPMPLRVEPGCDESTSDRARRGTYYGRRIHDLGAGPVPIKRSQLTGDRLTELITT